VDVRCLGVRGRGHTRLTSSRRVQWRASTTSSGCCWVELTMVGCSNSTGGTWPSALCSRVWLNQWSQDSPDRGHRAGTPSASRRSIGSGWLPASLWCTTPSMDWPASARVTRHQGVQRHRVELPREQTRGPNSLAGPLELLDLMIAQDLRELVARIELRKSREGYVDKSDRGRTPRRLEAHDPPGQPC